MKIFISTDAEGAAGVVDARQIVGSGPEYEIGRLLLLREVNAAIEGAIEGGATTFVVNDSHWTMQNLNPADLAGRATYISGRHKPLYMMQGLDTSFDCAFFIAYHASAGAERGVLPHTYDPAAIAEVKLNDVVVGESGINALVAMHHQVPVAMISGDEQTAEEASRIMPGIECVVVKRSVTHVAAESLHPDDAQDLIRVAARRSLQHLGSLSAPRIERPARLDIRLLNSDLAELATWVRGVERTGAHSVAIEEEDALRLYRSFLTVVALARSLT